jgi:hypothetical protein
MTACRGDSRGHSHLPLSARLTMIIINATVPKISGFEESVNDERN